MRLALSYSYIFYKVQKNPVNPAFKVYPVSKYIHNKNISIFTTHNKCTILPCMNHYKNCLTSLSVSNLDHYSLLKTESILNSTLSIQWKNCYWTWSSNTLATWCKELTHWKRYWCWEKLRAGGEESGRGRDG